MTITKSLVEKIQILDAASNISVINAFFEDYGESRGKVTIECDSDAWSYFWGAMGEGYTIKSFFLKAETDYLVRKFHRGIDSTINDDSMESLQEAAKKFILAARKNGEICKGDAYQKWSYIDQIDDRGVDLNGDFLYYIFGDEWWNDLPQIPNPKYKHLCQIVDSVKEAIKS